MTVIDSSDTKIMMMQSADCTVYAEMLRLGQLINRKYALMHSIDYLDFFGIKRGYFPWHACFNRIMMLNELIASGYSGWIFYLDADAYVYDLSFNVREYLRRFGDHAMVAAAGGTTGKPWDVNDGVFFLNLGQEQGRSIARLWYDDFMSTSEAALRAAPNWEDVPSDQPRLHKILLAHSELLQGLYIEDRAVFNNRHSSFVRQALRGRGFSIKDRMELMHSEIKSVLHAQSETVADESADRPLDTVQRSNDALIFRDFYNGSKTDWGRSSGPGSRPYFNIEYRAFLEKFITMNNIKSIVDVGCGDWQFMRFLNLDHIRYWGFDVVPEVVEANTQRYGGELISFSLMPDILDQVPSGDLLLMKDVLQHLPNATIHQYLRELCPKFKVCLITNSYEKQRVPRNVDIKVGGFRCLDLTAPPFELSGWYVCEFWTAAWERLRTFLHIPIRS